MPSVISTKPAESRKEIIDEPLFTG
jgi:hypothetical protein